MRLTVRPKVSALCIGGGGVGPKVPIAPMHPIKIRIPVPRISAIHIVMVPRSVFHIEPARKESFRIFV